MYIILYFSIHFIFLLLFNTLKQTLFLFTCAVLFCFSILNAQVNSIWKCNKTFVSIFNSPKADRFAFLFLYELKSNEKKIIFILNNLQSKPTCLEKNILLNTNLRFLLKGSGLLTKSKALWELMSVQARGVMRALHCTFLTHLKQPNMDICRMYAWNTHPIM